jgi:phage repressor protein C with HTH and peptisase S24 domain
VNTRLLDTDDARDGGLASKDDLGLSQGLDTQKFAHGDNGIDFSMAKSIEIAMEQSIDESITLAAMQTYGERVKIARERKGLSQAQLGKAIGGLKQPSVLAIEKRSTKSKYTLDIARITGVRPEWLDSGTGPMLPGRTETENDTKKGQEALTVQDVNVQKMVQDVPILGGASCGDDGLFELNGQILGYAHRPPRLIGVKDAYAVFIGGNSMFPWRKDGDLAFVNPHLPISIGNYVVVQLVPERGTNNPNAYIKRLERRTAESLRLHQYNPAEDINIPMKRVKSLHRVMDWSELLGL